MKLTNAQISTWAAFQPKPEPKRQPRWERVCMWLLAAFMLIVLAYTTVQGIGG